MNKIFFLVLCVFNCAIVSFKESKVTENDLKMDGIDPNKVAVVGFYKFKYDTVPYGNGTKTTATLDYTDPSMKESLGFGTPIEKIPSSGNDATVSEEKVKSFIEDFLSISKRSGIEEMMKVIHEQDGSRVKSS